MAIKYRLEYSSLGGYETRIDIDKNGYSGSIVPLTGSSNPFELVYEASEDYQFSKFKNSYCILEVRETADLVNDFKEIEDEDDYVLRYYRDNVLVWSGYVMQEQYVESDDINQPLSLRFYDGISRLKVFTFDDLGLGLPTNGTYTLSQVFQAVDTLLYANLGATRGFYFNDFLVNTLNISQPLTDLLYIQKLSFLDKDGISLDLYKILENIAASFNFTYLLYKDRFVVSNFEFSDNPKFVDFSNVAKPVLSFNKRKTITNQFVNLSKETTFFDSLKKMEINKKYDFPLTFINSNDFTSIVYDVTTSTGQPPTFTDNSIVFNSFYGQDIDYDIANEIDVNQNIRRDRYTYVYNTTPITIIKDPDYTESLEDVQDGQFILSFDYNISFDYNEDILLTNEDDLERVNGLLNESIIRMAFNIRGLSADGIETLVEREYLHQKYENGIVPVGGSPYLIQSMQLDNFARGTNINFDEIRVMSGTFSQGYNMKDINELTIKWFHPWYTLRSSNRLNQNNNSLRIIGMKYEISNVRLEKRHTIGKVEDIWVGTTDRNVFNYNLNRNKEVFYVNNLSETRYRFNLLDSSNIPIPFKSFKRKNKLYSGNRAETFDLYELVLNQSLEQFGVQQRSIRGDLFIVDAGFDILSSISINGVIFSIHKFTLNDYEGIHSVELIEIK